MNYQYRRSKLNKPYLGNQRGGKPIIPRNGPIVYTTDNLDLNDLDAGIIEGNHEFMDDQEPNEEEQMEMAQEIDRIFRQYRQQFPNVAVNPGFIPLMLTLYSLSPTLLNYSIVLEPEQIRELAVQLRAERFIDQINDEELDQFVNGPPEIVLLRLISHARSYSSSIQEREDLIMFLEDFFADPLPSN
jgi:hypothetical protein